MTTQYTKFIISNQMDESLVHKGLNMYMEVTKEDSICGGAQGNLVLIAYGQIPLINAHADVLSRARGLHITETWAQYACSDPARWGGGQGVWTP